MKFDRNNPRCYIAHIKCLAAMLLAWLVQLKRPRNHADLQPNVILYGHSLSGNLKAFFDYALDKTDLPYSVYYATIDRREYKKLTGIYGSRVVLATKVSVMRKILNSAIVMTSHGPGIFYLFRQFSPQARFIDVWHGVPFKVFAINDWKWARFYSAMFVPSEYFKEEMYLKRYKFDEKQLVVTGYARVDMFHNAGDIAERVRNQLDLTNTKYIILYAPTYRPKGEQGEIPFDLEPCEFLDSLNTLCEKIDATLIFRPHMNSQLQTIPTDYSRIRLISQKQYPQTNDLLAAVDLVLTDWSSIAVDFYALYRPVIYFESSIPSNHVKDTSLIERVGDHVNNIEELTEAIGKNLRPDRNELRKNLSGILNKCYGDTLDGCSGERYDQGIRKLL